MRNSLLKEDGRLDVNELDVRIKAQTLSDELRKNCRYLWSGGIDPNSIERVAEKYFRERMALR